MTDDELIKHVETSYLKAQSNQGFLEDAYRIQDLYSISSLKFKYLLNNLCTLPGAVLLELGCHRGGTLVSSLYKNTLVAAYAVDNFSYDPLSLCTNTETQSLSNFNPKGWGNVKMTLIENLERFALDKSVKLHSGDWNTISGSFLKHKVNILHIDLTVNETIENVLKFYDPKLTETFVLVLANYNEAINVRNALDTYVTNRRHLIKFKIEETSPSNSDTSRWWNGLGLFVIEKMGNINV